MKHTMKKLLCMALAIMLLVSAVPVFAAATEPTSNVLVTITVDGSSYKNNQEPLNNAMTVNNALKQYFPANWEQLYWATDFVRDGVPTDDSTTVNGASVISATLTTKTTSITVKMNGVAGVAVTRKINENLNLNNDLLREATLVIPAGQEIKGWNIEGGSSGVSNNTSVPVTYPMTVNALVGDVVNGSNENNNNNNNVGTTYNVKFYDVNGTCHWNIDVASGSTVGIADNSTATQISYAEEHVGTKSGYTFSGWQKNGTGDVLSTATVADLAITANTEFRPVFTANSSSSGSGSSGTTTNKFPYDVYLNIYKDTLVGSADKSVKITNGIALDGLVTLAEVKNVVKNYYTAKDSDGISYDGLYLAQGNWVANYVADTQKYDSIKAGEMRQTGTVYINVMIGNAKAKSTATADTSNPKTGDTIFVPFMVMGVTATALAAAYVFGKKRIAR